MVEAEPHIQTVEVEDRIKQIVGAEEELHPYFRFISPACYEGHANTRWGEHFLPNRDHPRTII
jgi:hypothetical protein